MSDKRFPLCFAGYEPVYSQPPPSGLFIIRFYPQGPSVPGWAIAGIKKPSCAPFRRSHSDTSAVTPVVQIGFASLPRLPNWHGQSLYPPRHDSEQAQRQIVLCQQQPLDMKFGRRQLPAFLNRAPSPVTQ